MLAWSLLKHNAGLHIADGDLPGGASQVAAGIINPITGKRFVKSWRFDDFFPAARNTYLSLCNSLSIDAWTESPVVRLLSSPEETNDWSARCALPEYAGLLAESETAGEWSELIRPGFRYGLILQSARVNFSTLLPAFRQWATAEGRFHEQTIDYQDVENLTKDYDAIVFCEGYRAKDNPFFPGLPWQIAKGEALLIRFINAEKIPEAEMLKKTMMLVPLGEGLFWAGGSYQWHYPQLTPDEKERNYMVNHLKDMLDVPFEIAGHVAGVRPTVKDRRPFFGQSHVNPKVFIFNGLGTKGALLAPYWAERFAAYLLEGTPLEVEVDIRRFA